MFSFTVVLYCSLRCQVLRLGRNTESCYSLVFLGVAYTKPYRQSLVDAAPAHNAHSAPQHRPLSKRRLILHANSSTVKQSHIQFNFTIPGLVFRFVNAASAHKPHSAPQRLASRCQKDSWFLQQMLLNQSHILIQLTHSRGWSSGAN